MEELFKYIDNVRFKNRPSAICGSYRIVYRVTQIILTIKLCCRPRKACSIEKFQIISDAVSYNNSLDRLMLFMKGNINNINVRYDPSMNRALTYAVEEDLIFLQGNRLFQLTKKGKEYAQEILDDKSIFTKEKAIMRQISTELTEEKIQDLMKDWRLNNA